MDFEKSSILSFYEELTTLDEEKNVFLVKHVDTGDILVKKIKEIYNLSVYERLKKSDLPGVPKIYECFEADTL